MRIAIIGSGNIGGTLGAKWAAAGHQVVFGVRDPQSAKAQAALEATGGAARLASIGESLVDAEVILLSLPAAAVADFVAEHGAALNNKLVIDATNKFGQPVVNSFATIESAAPQAILVRAFNALGWEHFAEPQLNGQQIDLFYVSSDGEPRKIIEGLIADIGLRPIRVGDHAQVGLVDAMGSLWVALAFGQQRGRKLAFKMLSNEE
jgi:8-hydroxy-5-deazaflavin:NADPH oxidoreductase